MSAPPPDPAAPAATGALAALLAGLVLSGLAGIVNQVVWQRALKLFLGGSETLSAMIVVLVFLFGLGAGAWLASRRVGALRNPLAVLALVELGLVAVNTVVTLILGLDISESVQAAWRLAAGAGLPLRLVYGLAAALVLLPPTLLMGATVPLASEGAQRQLGATKLSLVPALFFVNTLGAAMGALSASLWLLPVIGQRRSLLVAVACNGGAALLVGLLGRRAPVQPRPPAAQARAGGLSREELLGGVFGLLALGYEMLLFRSLSLAHWPLPVTFAAGLCGFLVAWSLGVALSGRIRPEVAPVALLTAAAVACLPSVLDWDRAAGLLGLGGSVALYTLPCLGFGWIYGLLVTRATSDWGRDVGRYAAVNTLGSCLGVLLFTLVGFEAPLQAGAGALAVGTAACAVLELFPGLRGRLGALAVAAWATMILVKGVLTPLTVEGETTTWWGRDGVVEVHEDGSVTLDGLWHTRLSDGRNHIGRPYSWVMAMAAVLAHEGAPKRALVIGAGVGVSSVTLAGVQDLQVDGYEINHTLRRVLEAWPDRTLKALHHPQLRWIWQDARVGLALDETRYDIILSAPLHLRQAGSSMLLSEEYLRLVRSRLAPGGILAVYANEGEAAQALLVQRTLADLFPYRVAWYEGFVTVVSDRPIDVSPARIAARMAQGDRLAEEMRILDAELSADGGEGIFGLFEGEPTAGLVADRPITDDQPLLEYPSLAESRVQAVSAASIPSAAPR